MMKAMRAAAVLGVLGLLLGAGVLVQFLAQTPAPASMARADGRELVSILPARLSGATARDEAIALTEEMKEAVGELLNYDDAVYRIYQLPGTRVAVYVAWWRPGRMSPRLVAGHTPDVCWPASGWRRDPALGAEQADLERTIRRLSLATGECRTFVRENRSEHVVFWHRVGERFQSYSTGYAPPWWAPFAEMWRDGLNLRKEQLFVRISSDQPLAEVLARPEVEPLLVELRRLGLEAK